MHRIGRRLACSLFVLFACLCALASAAPAPQADAARQARVAAFARLYGVVRYFYPGDAAQDIDWNGFAMLGAAEARAAKDDDDLRARLRALFDPLGPGIDIVGERETFPPAPTEASPPLVAWRYKGFPSSESRAYAGERTGRAVSNGYTTLGASVDARALRGKTLRLRAELRPLQALHANQLGLWLDIGRPQGKPGTFENSVTNANTGDAWQAHEVLARVDEDATGAGFGLMMQTGAPGVSSGGLRHLTLEVGDGKGAWRPVETPSLREAAVDGASAQAWSIAGPLREGAGASWQADDGGYLQLRYARDPSGTTLFDAPAIAGKTATLELGAGLKARVALTLADAQARAMPARAQALAALKARLPSLPVADRDIPAEARQADVIVAWSVLRHFYPYWDVIPDDWDARLAPALAEARTGASRELQRQTLQRLIAALQDGHGTVYDERGPKRASLPVRFAPVGDRWVVLASSVPDKVRAGDVVAAVDGVPAAQEKARLEALASAQPSARPWKALAPLTFGTRGTVRTLSLQRQDGSTVDVALPFEAETWPDRPRPATIAELRPGVLYVDLSRLKQAQLADNLERLARARALVFDMRDYPSEAAFDVLPHLLQAPEQARWMHIPLYTGPFGERAGYRDSGWNLQPRTPRLRGRALFLVNGSTISYGESIMGYVRELGLGTIVGSTTCGANGNVTDFDTPSGFNVMFTGMRVTRHDGVGRYHALGTPPDVAAEPTVAGIRAGRDEVLEAALKLLD
ncbi:S41 family peptidase [Luteimonas aquatica]|uniref:S41 family peptidase n=1 Tax=Luteimonas aquatica TaxID=450364 RepID=UPI001F59CE01|nr:S41 family peptidase [Luteimonas aquatica]